MSNYSRIHWTKASCRLWLSLFGLASFMTSATSYGVTNDSFPSFSQTLHDDNIFEIIRRVDLSNTELIEMRTLGRGLKSSAEFIMRERLQSWLSKEEFQRLADEASAARSNNPFAYMFLSIEKAWRQNIFNERTVTYRDAGVYSRLKDIDPHDKNITLVLARSNTSRSLQIVDFNQKRSVTLLRYAMFPEEIYGAKFIQSRYEEPSKEVLMTTADGVFLVDIATASQPSSMHHTSEGFTQISEKKFLRILHAADPFGRPGFGKYILSNDDEVAIYDPKDREMKSLYEANKIEQILFLGRNLYIVSHDRLRIEDVFTERSVASIDLSGHGGEKTGFISSDEPNTVLILTELGTLLKYAIPSGEVIAKNYLGWSCGRSSPSASMIPGSKRFVISCTDDQTKTYDLDTLKEINSVSNKGASQNILAMGATSKKAVSWNRLRQSLLVYDTDTGASLGKMSSRCQTMSSKFLLCFKPDASMASDATIRQAVINPWDQNRLITTDGKAILVWDLDQKKVKMRPITSLLDNEYADIYTHPSDPNTLYMLGSSGSFVMLSYFQAVVP